jgi:peptidoglycan hydrolase-like protein with peptidoglycan-binding domain
MHAEKLRGAVGAGGHNQAGDVTRIQVLINRNLKYIPGTAPLKEDGRVGPITVAAIRQYQSKVVRLRLPDGRVDVDGPTYAALSARAAPAAGMPATAVKPGLSEEEAKAFETAVAGKRKARGGNCMTASMAGLGVTMAQLPRNNPSVRDIATATNAETIAQQIDFTVSATSGSKLDLAYRGASRPSQVIAQAAAAAGGGIRVFLMSLADRTHTVSVIARPRAGGGYVFSYLDQHHSPAEERYSFDAAGFDRRVEDHTKMLINTFHPGNDATKRISHRLTIWRVPR